MRYDYDVKELLKNPKVSYADRWKVYAQAYISNRII